MTTEGEIRGTAVAGVTLLPAALRYDAVGCSFGSAVLVREAVTGVLARFDLALSPEAAEESRRAGGVASREIALDPREWVTEIWSALEPGPAMALGLRALLVEHSLLSRPELLRGNPPEGVQGEAREVLQGITRTLDAATGRGEHAGAAPRECRECAAMRAAMRAAMPWDAHGGAIRPLWKPTRGGPSDRDIETLERLLASALGNAPWSGATALERDCPHVAMAFEALRVASDAHPQLAFELAGLVEPVAQPDGARLVVVRWFYSAMLGQWLTRRPRDEYGELYGDPDDDEYGDGYDDSDEVPYGDPFDHRRGGGIRDFSARQTAGAPRFALPPERAAQMEALPVEMRPAVGYSATVWHYGLTPEAIQSRGEEEPRAGEAPPRMWMDVSPDERVDVPRMLPEPTVEGTKGTQGTPRDVVAGSGVKPRGAARKVKGRGARK